MTSVPDPTGPITAALALGGLAFLLSILLIAGAAALGLWILYTVIWRAVRRGLREYNYPGIKIKGLSGRSIPTGNDSWSLGGN